VNHKRRQYTLELTVRFTPLPSSIKRTAFEAAFDLLADLLLEEISRNQAEIERSFALSLAQLQPVDAG
jgi:hypothetical protein